MRRTRHADSRSFDEATTAELIRRLCVYLVRGLRLKCPECGITPVFMPALRTRSVHDWVTPLDGCPRCGYAYQREGGYFLIASWGVHYFVVTGLCLVAALVVDNFVPMSFPTLAVSVAAKVCVWDDWLHSPPPAATRPAIRQPRPRVCFFILKLQDNFMHSDCWNDGPSGPPGPAYVEAGPGSCNRA